MAVDDGARAYFAARRAHVKPFIDAHFSLSGTLRLHRAALGWGHRARAAQPVPRGPADRPAAGRARRAPLLATRCCHAGPHDLAAHRSLARGGVADDDRVAGAAVPSGQAPGHRRCAGRCHPCRSRHPRPRAGRTGGAGDAWQRSGLPRPPGPRDGRVRCHQGGRRRNHHRAAEPGRRGGGTAQADAGCGLAGAGAGRHLGAADRRRRLSARRLAGRRVVRLVSRPPPRPRW